MSPSSGILCGQISFLRKDSAQSQRFAAFNFNLRLNFLFIDGQHFAVFLLNLTGVFSVMRSFERHAILLQNRWRDAIPRTASLNSTDVAPLSPRWRPDREFRYPA